MKLLNWLDKWLDKYGLAVVVILMSGLILAKVTATFVEIYREAENKKAAERIQIAPNYK